MIFRYVVASCNGHGIHGPEWERFKDAREHALGVAGRQSTVVLGPFEVERVGYLDRIGGTRRYWMRQGKRWVPWAYDRDHTVRRPDFIVFEAFDPARPEVVA